MATKRARTKKTVQTGGTVHQLRITLLDVDPPIWRRVLVSSKVTLGDLNFILQAAMGWTNSHLHRFTINGVKYSNPRFEVEDAENEFARRLTEAAPVEGLRFNLLYDFGDGWDHEVVVEKVMVRESGRPVPLCIAGERSCPPEDCGGPWGYRDFLEAVGDPENEERDAMREWAGGAFDPEAFDPAALNKRLPSDVELMAGRR